MSTDTQVGGAIERIHTLTQMETPKSAAGVFELPCGIYDERTQTLLREVQVREITGHEEDMLASTQIAAPQKISALLSGCVMRVGSETDRNKIGRMIMGMTVGDRVFLIFAIRRVTLGDELPVREKCPQCNTTTLFMVDLAKDMQSRPMPDPTKRVFDVTLPSGVQVRFRVSTGEDEARLAKLVKRNKQAPDALSLSLLMRLELLGDEKPSLEMVKSLGMRDRNFLRDKFQEVEGGVDTTLELECPSCGNEWEKDLDLGAASFFFPGGRRRR